MLPIFSVIVSNCSSREGWEYAGASYIRCNCFKLFIGSGSTLCFKLFIGGGGGGGGGSTLVLPCFFCPTFLCQLKLTGSLLSFLSDGFNRY